MTTSYSIASRRTQNRKNSEVRGHSRGSGKDGPLLRVVDGSRGVGDAKGNGSSGGEVHSPHVRASGGLGAERLDGSGTRLSSGDDC